MSPARSIAYSHHFVRQFKKLPANLQEEVLAKIELFKNEANHATLKVHPLQGHLAGCMSFSVNFRFRIVYGHLSDHEVILHSVGSHDIYR